MTRRGQMPSGGQSVLDGPRRRLASLQPMIEAYSIKAWYTVPSAHSRHGVDPNAPREPAYFGERVRLAARVADVLLDGNVALLGECNCAPCACVVWETDSRGRPSYRPCEHDLACPHRGADDEDTEKLSQRLRDLVARVPRLARAFKDGGVDGVYELAGLTVGETAVTRYQHEGLSRSSIAFITSRQDGTVNALLARAHFKLRALIEDSAVAA